MAVTRPLKEGSVTTYQQKVAAGFPDILASEMDADLDTIYAAWNGGVATANIIDGAVTEAKLATDAHLWTAASGPLRPVSTATVAVPGDATGTTVLLGSTTAKGRLQMPVNLSGAVGLLSNRNWLSGNAQDDATKASWALMLGNGDQILVQRSPAGSTTQASLLTLDYTGSLTLQPFAAANWTEVRLYGVGTTVGGLFRGFQSRGSLGAATPTLDQDIIAGLVANGCYGAGVYSEQGYARLIASGNWSATSRGTTFQVLTTPLNSTALSNNFQFDYNGNLTISGTLGIKASGTTWNNPSDPRLKEDVAPYAAGLAEILRLEPISYRLKAQPAGPLCYGFDAAAVKDVLPECVSTMTMKLPGEEEDTEGVLMFDMHPILVALVNAVKEVAARVAALETR
jgi:hypothetical protein